MKIYSPWAEVDGTNPVVLNPRLDTLEGKTIGLFAHFKGHSPLMLQILSQEIAKEYPTAEFKSIQLKRDTTEAFNLPDFDKELKEWLKEVDCVISAYGDAGSCCMFQTYNTVYVEKLGKPAVMLTKEDLLPAGKKAAASRLCPNLRFVTSEISDLTWVPELNEGVQEGIIRPGMKKMLHSIIDALTVPLTEEEKTPFLKDNRFAQPFEVDSTDGLSDIFYKNGWTTGLPIIPPTEEAVKEMLTGTDLAPDTLIAKIPPMRGMATVEKIAINAVMAGCKPTALPVLIAAVKAITQPIIHLEGWTCSVASWMPILVIAGKAAKDLGLNTTAAAISSYDQAASTIARAYAYIIMNISGVRPGKEDLCEIGHEGRQAMVVGDIPHSELNPWEDLQEDFGYTSEDSTVTMFWAQERTEGHGGNPAGCFKSMYRVNYGGWDRGALYILSPGFVRRLDKGGFHSRKAVLNYIQQYGRHSAANINFRWMYDNNHVPEGVVLPTSKNESAPLFWTTDHMMLVVSGSNYDATVVNFAGGGEHGGPASEKIDLPKNWRSLIEKYTLSPNYQEY